MAPVCEDDSSTGPCAACLVSGALCWLSAAPLRPGDGSLRSPPAMHFKVGDQGLTCAWNLGNDNGSVGLHRLLRASLGNTKAWRLLPQYCSAWEGHTQEGKEGIHTGSVYSIKTEVGLGSVRCTGETEWQRNVFPLLPFDCWSINW